MNSVPRKGRFGLLALAFSLTFSHSSILLSQNSENDEVYELSPFQIQAEEGWTATETLAGSRLRTDFKDVATQIETMTMDFMDEYALNSIEQAAIYSMNMESRDETVYGNGLQEDLNGGLRIRGLAGPTNSREFFNSMAPSDNYNLDRVTIASGPNSVLFGTGSPAGVVNSSLKRAVFNDIGKLKLQFDNFGGTRYEIDVNRVLMEDKLALRVAGVLNDRRWETEPSGEYSKRIYTTLTYKPWENTTISAHYENYDINSNRPPRNYPFDLFTPWFDASSRPTAGYPSMHIFQNDLAWIEAGRPLDGDLFERGNNNPRIILTEGQSGNEGIWGYNTTVNIRDPENWSTVSPINREADGWTILDDTYFPTNLNTAAFARQTRDGGEVWNTFVNHKIAENFFFEFAFQHETDITHLDQHMNYIGSLNIEIDPNAFMPDGVTPNPNVGKFYVEGGNPQIQRGGAHSKDWRAALSYEFDFRDKTDNLGWLGRHRLASLLSRSENERKQQSASYVITPKTTPNGVFQFPNLPGVEFEHPYRRDESGNYLTDDNGNFIPTGNSPRFLENGQNLLTTRYYFNSDLTDVPTPHRPIGDGLVWTIEDADGEVFTLDPINTGFYDEHGRRLVREAIPNYNKNKQDTLQFSYQGFWLGDRIITTYGYREDEIFQAGILNGRGRDNFTGFRPYFEDVEFGPFGEGDRGITRTTGVVVHPLKDWVDLPGDAQVSAFYNESDTFQPNTSAFRPFGGTYPGALGDGKDKGAALTMFNGRFSIRYNKFENSSGPARAANTPFNRIRWQISPFENRVRNLDSNLPVIDGINDEAFPNLGNGDPYWVVSFKRASGEEIGVTWQATDNIDVRFNYNNQEVTESDIGLEWFNDQGTGWLDQRIPVYESISIPEGGTGNPRDLNNDGIVGTWTWDTWNEATGTYPLPWSDSNPPNPDGSGGETFKDRFERIVINGNTGVNIIQALDGKSNEFVRDNRANLNVMYRFREGKLKGFNAGGAIRWRAAPLLGYGAQTIAGQESIDLSKPFYGEDEMFVDLSFRYSGKAKFLGERNYVVGLNVRNATNEGDIPSILDVNGSPIRFARVDQTQYILSFETDL